MTALERLTAAHQATAERRYEDALRDLVWFHEHALDEDRSWHGVRLSYALCDWVELGKHYPPARSALEAVRDRKTQALLNGESDRALFQDVQAINERLDQANATHALYLALAERFPALADQCAGLALPAIVAAQDYALANRLRPAPDTEIRTRAGDLAAEVAMIRRLPYTRAPRRWAAIRGYADLVRRHLAITAGIGDAAGARRLQALAVDLIQSPPLRAAVRKEIARRDDLPRLYRRGWARAGRKYSRRQHAK